MGLPRPRVLGIEPGPPGPRIPAVCNFTDFGAVVIAVSKSVKLRYVMQKVPRTYIISERQLLSLSLIRST